MALLPSCLPQFPQSAAGEQQSGAARAEALLAQAQKAAAASKAVADAAAAALDACQKRLAEAKEAAAAQNKGKSTPAQSAGSSNGQQLANGVAGSSAPPASPSKEELDAKFALPDRLKDYTGETPPSFSAHVTASVVAGSSAICNRADVNRCTTGCSKSSTSVSSCS